MSTIYTFARSKLNDPSLKSSILSSNDGITWTTVPNSLSSDFNSSTITNYDKPVLIVKLNGNTIYFRNHQYSVVFSSNGGSSWIDLSSILTNVKNYQTIYYNGDYLICFGSNSLDTSLYVAKSYDGISWTEYLVDDSFLAGNVYSFWNGVKWVSVYEHDDGNGVSLLTRESSDGQTWSSSVPIQNTNDNIPQGITYFQNKWVISTKTSLFSSVSSNSSSWNTSLSFSYDDNNYMSIVDNTLLVCNKYGQLSSTTDLINWTNTTISGFPSIGSYSDTYNNINKIDNNYVMVINAINTITFPFQRLSYLGYSSSLNSPWTFSSANNTDRAILSMFVYELPLVIPCLVKGMEVNIENGVKKVEDLKVGDTVVDILGRKIKVVKVLSKKVTGDKYNIPYIIPKDFFEKDIPTKDIHLSYNHAYFYNGNWELPIHNDNLKRDESYLGKDFTYYHVGLPDYAYDKLACYNLPIDSFDNSKYNEDNMI